MWRHRQIARAAKQAAGLTGKDLLAIEYPEDRLLRRHLTLPDMTAQDVAQAAALDASSAAPFPSEDLVWGHACTAAPDGRLELDVVMASRKQIQAYLETLGEPRSASHQPEVWAWSDIGAPVVLQGFGEARRYRQLTQRRWAGWALLALACVLVAAIAVTPTAQLRLDAIAAVQSYDALHQRTAPLVSKRAALLKSTDQLALVEVITADRVRAVDVMDLLTRALPDDASLLGLQIAGSKILLNGQTSNTADLMQKLSAFPGLKDVKSPSAATRPLGASKESFTIELQLADGWHQPVRPGAAPDPSTGGQRSAWPTVDATRGNAADGPSKARAPS